MLAPRIRSWQIDLDLNPPVLCLWAMRWKNGSVRFSNDLSPNLEAYLTSIGFKSQKLTSMHKIQERTCNPRSTVLFASEYAGAQALFDVSRSECCKTVLILETPFWVSGAVESMNICVIVIGASNKSGRRCKPSDAIDLIYLMYLDLSVTKRCLFWRHRFG